MKTLKELFTDAGISEETQVKFNELLKGGHTNGSDLEVVIANNGEYVRAEKYDNLKSQLDTITKEKETFSQKVSEYDALKGKYSDLETEFNNFKTTASGNESKLRKQFEIEKRLISNNLPPINGSYNSYIEGIDLNAITINDKGQFEGIDEVFNKFKDNNKSLIERFNTTVIPPDDGAAKKETKKIDHAAFAKMSIEERIKLKNENPALYETIKTKK